MSLMAWGSRKPCPQLVSVWRRLLGRSGVSCQACSSLPPKGGAHLCRSTTDAPGRASCPVSSKGHLFSLLLGLHESLPLCGRHEAWKRRVGNPAEPLGPYQPESIMRAASRPQPQLNEIMFAEALDKLPKP